MSRKILITIFVTAIALLCWGVDLSAQEKKDDKKLEITGYFGAGGRGTEGGYGSTFDVLNFGVGLEYFLSPRISIEGQINYLPNIAYALPPYGGLPPWGEAPIHIIGQEQKYRLLWDVNFLFYFDLTKFKKPAMRWFLTVGTGFQYDRVEDIVVSLKTLEQFKYGYGSFWFQMINFGAGFNVNITKDWALRLIYKIHAFAGEEAQTNRLVIGLSYRF